MGSQQGGLANSTPPNRPGNGALAALYNHSDSFAPTSNDYVDLTKDNKQTKATQDIWFGIDDISDDDDLDLDFQAPLPCPKELEPKPKAKENQAPPQTQPIAWSSSPPSHWEAPKPSRSMSGLSSKSDDSQKRVAVEDLESSGAPLPKKAKRTLPWKTTQDPIVVKDDDDVYSSAKTPAPKSNGFWDPSASAVKEQKRLLKNQRNPQEIAAETEMDIESFQESLENHGPKNTAISLSPEQKDVLDLVVNRGQSVFFTGPAGTGKSVLMRAIIDEMKKKHSRDPERIAVTASTGLAACNIGGITLHSFSGMIPSDDTRRNKVKIF